MDNVSGLWGIAAVFLAAFLGYAVSFAQEKRTSKTSRQRLLAIAVGELNSITSHYQSSIWNIKENSASEGFRIALIKAKYGHLNVLSADFLELGFLSDKQISHIINLATYMRNNDIHIDSILGQSDDKLKLAQDDIDRLQARFLNTSKISMAIINSILRGDQQFDRTRLPQIEGEDMASLPDLGNLRKIHEARNQRQPRGEN